LPRLRRNFSLFEIIIVVLIIGFIMGVAAIQMDSIMPSSRLKKQSRETANLMELAISQSAIEGKTLALVFNTENRTMNLEVHPEDKSLFDLSLEELEALVLYSSTWPESITLLSVEVNRLDDAEVSDQRILFFPEGSSEGATVMWQESSGLKQSIELWPLLGKVDILPLDQTYVY